MKYCPLADGELLPVANSKLLLFCLFYIEDNYLIADNVLLPFVHSNYCLAGDGELYVVTITPLLMTNRCPLYTVDIGPLLTVNCC